MARLVCIKFQAQERVAGRVAFKLRLVLLSIFPRYRQDSIIRPFFPRLSFSKI
jgi:hypothetical protein